VHRWMGVSLAAFLAATAWAAARAAGGGALPHLIVAQADAGNAQSGAAGGQTGAASPERGVAAERAPTADQILQRYVQALGGERAIRKITSRVMKGKFEAPIQQMTGEAVIYTAAPDRFYSRVTIPDVGEFVSAFDGKVGWSSDPEGGAREMHGQELLNMRRSSQFQHELRFREIFPQVRVLEKASEGDRPVWVLEATPAEGGPEKFYFDAETGLLLRHDSTQFSQGEEVPIEHRYSNYAPVDGVQVPRLLRHKDPKVEWQVTFSEVRQNVPVDAAGFSMPAATPAPH